MKTPPHWSPDSGKLSITARNLLAANKSYREHTSAYWPNKGIKGHELQKIYGKIVASDRTLAGEASPDNDSNNTDNKATGGIKTSPSQD
jgi:hypothetical protein